MTVTLQNPRTSSSHEVRRTPTLNPPRDPLAPARGILHGVVLVTCFWSLVLMLVVGLLIWLR